MAATKRCSICREEKSHGDFYACKRNASGLLSHCIACDRAKSAKWRAANQDRKKEHDRAAWGARSQEAIDASRASALAHYEANRTRIIARSTKWRAEHPIESMEIGRRHRSTHLLAHRLRQQRRRARKRALISTLTKAEWVLILESFGHRCAYCLRPGVLTLDHVIPISRGGPHTAENVVPACRGCNSRKGHRGLFSFVSESAQFRPMLLKRAA